MFVKPDPSVFREELDPAPGAPAPVAVARFKLCAAVDVSLIKSYSEMIVKYGKSNKKIVALDADLILDTGLIEFKNKFPNRFFECGIAEQDMVSKAGGMALTGMLPIVHSFSSFLSARPNEQIYNNASEGNKIIYVGSLAGLLPAGPGHSHQAVRDISNIGSIPNIYVIEPSCAEELDQILDWGINKSERSIYIRLNSLATEINFKYPTKNVFRIGEGFSVKKGKDAIMFTYGPMMLNEVLKTRKLLIKEKQFYLEIVNLSSLNFINSNWLKKKIKPHENIFCLDNHYIVGGLGDRLSCLISSFNVNKKFINLGLEKFPECGTNDEILKYHSMDYKSISKKILKISKKFYE